MSRKSQSLPCTQRSAADEFPGRFESRMREIGVRAGSIAEWRELVEELGD